MTPRETLFQLARSQNGELTKKQAVEAIGGRYYCNADHHVGEVLSKMVKAGLFERIKPGHFKVKNINSVRTTGKADPNQQSIF